jgi:hypothetical protein
MSSVVESPARQRPAGYAVAAGGMLAVVLTIVLVAGLDAGTAITAPAALRRTISEYGLGPDAWIFTSAVVLLAAGSVAALVTLVRHGILRLRSGASIALMLWILGMIVIAIFPKQDRTQAASMGGGIHRLASLVAFLSLPIAAFLLARAWKRHDTWAPFARRTRALGFLSVVMFSPLVYSIIVGIMTGTAWWRVLPIGYVERGLLLAEVITVLVIGHWSMAAAATPSKKDELVDAP